MFKPNSIDFYNFICAENSVLYANSQAVFFTPSLHCNFVLDFSNKLQLLQTTAILNQFFHIRPKIGSKKKFAKFSTFTLATKVKSKFLSTLIFYTIGKVRNSSRKKLINFDIKASGEVFIKFKDFITLFPFKIGIYDFHNWRKNLVIKESVHYHSLFEKSMVWNFYSSFFRNHYGEIS
jgi:hypothetical protein